MKSMFIVDELFTCLEGKSEEAIEKENLLILLSLLLSLLLIYFNVESLNRVNASIVTNIYILYTLVSRMSC